MVGGTKAPMTELDVTMDQEILVAEANSGLIEPTTKALSDTDVIIIDDSSTDYTVVLQEWNFIKHDPVDEVPEEPDEVEEPYVTGRFCNELGLKCSA